MFTIEISDEANRLLFRMEGVRSDRLPHVMHAYWQSTTLISGRYTVHVIRERRP